METVHPEGGDSPFIVKDDVSIAGLIAMDDEKCEEYASCPVEGCGEAIPLTELEMHLEMHEEELEVGDSEQSEQSLKRLRENKEGEATFDAKLSHAFRNLPNDNDIQEGPIEGSYSPDQQNSAKSAWKNLLRIPDLPSKASTTKKSSRRRLGVSDFPACISEI
jgi:hypothetical protein